jgi:hypothetical protein
MTVVAQLAIEAEQSEFDRVLAELPEDGLVAAQKTESSSAGQRIVELRVDDGETLMRLHEACANKGLLFDVQRIAQEPTETADRQRLPQTMGTAAALKANSVPNP